MKQSLQSKRLWFDFIIKYVYLWLTVKLIEGKNREIRRTMQALGYEVNKLIRISYAGLELRKLEKSQIYEVKIPQKLLEKFKEFKG